MRVLFGILLLIAVYSNANADDRFYEVNTRSNEIKIMGYNVQNLFDAEHDEGKNDYEFLPKSSKWKKYCDPKIKPITTENMLFNFGWVQACFDTDWTAKKVAQKLERIKKSRRFPSWAPGKTSRASG